MGDHVGLDEDVIAWTNDRTQRIPLRGAGIARIQPETKEQVPNRLVDRIIRGE